jgi:hypothetical protein
LEETVMKNESEASVRTNGDADRQADIDFFKGL